MGASVNVAAARGNEDVATEAADVNAETQCREEYVEVVRSTEWRPEGEEVEDERRGGKSRRGKGKRQGGGGGKEREQKRKEDAYVEVVEEIEQHGVELKSAVASAMLGI